MELDIKGNPGNNNSFQDNQVDRTASFNPNAKEVHVNQYLQQQSPDYRLISCFRELQEEVRNDDRLQKKLDDIKRYRTRLPHTIGLKAKLQDGGFSKDAIDKACRQKQYYAKKSTKYQYYEGAQKIDSYLFAIVSSRFDTYVMPLIVKQSPLNVIKKVVYEQVIMPVVDKLAFNGEKDTELRYNIDDIFGMLYYLTGNCHINWKEYHV
ncbi:MAG: ABC-three component system protein [Prevotella sp.]|jgi:cell division protein FtsB